MARSSSLFIINNLTQKIVHGKTGHHFLLYTSLNGSGESFSIDLTLSSSQEVKDETVPSNLLIKWWSATWTEKEIGNVDDVVQAIEQGELRIRGWTKSKMSREDLELKLLVGPDDSRLALTLQQCSSEEASQRRAALLLKITEQAQESQCRLFSPASYGASQAEIENKAEIAQLTQILLSRDETIDELMLRLETINDQLKEYIKAAEPPKPTRYFPKPPANHSKMSVFKKRRLVQQVEYED
ncbi:hypothetical protein FRB94_008834 [Tulasnella sp. JGI-2019a]|nr:hypothetical protein FRB93_012904 [Tulasnella sp. JGI-2019a]KAG9011234.1 hypothetical protein FRB94_008834 [Tulasnella sp. JGI-2019a]KAG9035322.1 hypothetical protein FRB95_011472 [Tulasnella sp. JGI-2019a]